MAATKLGLYNGALRLCKERKLASLTENREPRRLLDDAYGDGSTNGAVRHCLQLGQWTHAIKTIQLDFSPSVNPDFGYQYGFDQPSDLVRVTAVCQDEYLNIPLTRYADERGYWYSDLETIYVSYVSNDSSYGADLTLWPESFVKLVEAYLANEIAGSLTGSDPVKVEKALTRALKSARSLDAMNRPTAFMPTGSWASARQGRSSSWSRSRAQ